MKSGYDQFFKNAKKVAAGERPEPILKTASFASKGTATRRTSNELASDLRKKMRPQLKKKSKRATPWKLIGASVIGLGIASFGLLKTDAMEFLMKNVEISILGTASADEAAPAAKSPEAQAPQAVAPVKSEYSQEEINHFAKLNDRKKELDAREEELNRAEGELQAQRTEIEKKMTDLETTRRNISSVLEEKVKIDAGKVDTLVQMYQNMKPQQAAKVFETMDENLAIEILGRMKKKNAAEIMGFVKPEKVQVLTEKFAGYKN